MPPAIEKLKNAILNDNECLEALDEFINQARKEAKEIMSKNIQIKEPQNLEQYLDGYEQGYQNGIYDYKLTMYQYIKNGGQEATKEFINKLFNEFEHGGHQCA